jgi:hypothetical protein
MIRVEGSALSAPAKPSQSIRAGSVNNARVPAKNRKPASAVAAEEAPQVRGSRYVKLSVRRCRELLEIAALNGQLRDPERATRLLPRPDVGYR